MVQIVPRIALVLWFAFLVLLERIFPLRKAAESRLRHDGLNISYFAINTFLNIGLAALLLTRVENGPSLFKIPIFPLRPLVVFLILDLLIYYWHRLNHQSNFLWRFHKFHHTDREMDVSTALRFHSGEFIFSALYKSIVMVVLGITLTEYIFFELVVTASSLFHHSNLKLPVKLDNILSWIIVTPLFHHSHHSEKNAIMNAHYSTVFTAWDRIHKSMASAPAEQIIIGVSDYPLTPQFVEGLKVPFK